MKTINIKGKPYVMVNDRIKTFRESDQYKDWSLISEIVELKDDSCVIKAIIMDDKGVIRATGLAQEDKMSSLINKTSFVENCETSAWGRALGNLGIGIDDSIASAEEVSIAIAKQISQEADPVDIVGKDYTFNSGKYEGKTIGYVLENDKQYLDYLLASDKVNNTIKANIMEACKNVL